MMARIVKFIGKNYLVLILIGFFAILYFSTLYPGVGGRVNYGDSAKWQFLWAVGGTPHSTGYPLYLMLSKLFGNTLVFLEPAYRIAVISTLSALGTLFVLYKVSEQFIGNRLAQIVPSFILGGTFPFWSQATEAEVYTLNSLFVTLVIYFSIRFYRTKNTNYFLIMVAIYALSFGNHLTMIMLLPALLYIVFSAGYQLIFTKKVIVYTVIFFVLGASQYLYILYLSHYSTVHLEYIGHNASPKHWISYITGGQFGDKLLRYQTIDGIYYKGLQRFVLQFWDDVGWALIIILLYKLLYQKTSYESHSKITIFLLLIALFELLNASTYGVYDALVYYIPVYIVISLFFVKIVDYLPSKSTTNLYIFLLLISNLFFIIDKYEFMKIKTNPAYQSIKSYFRNIPNDSYLYIPKENFYTYDGFEALFYAEYIDFAGTNRHHIYKLGETKGNIYIPEEFLKYISKRKDALTRQYSNGTLYDFLKENNDKLIIITAKDEAKKEINNELTVKLKTLGLHFDKLGYGGSYTAVIDKGRVVLEKINNEGTIDLQNTELLQKFGIERLTSSGYSFDNYSKIIFSSPPNKQSKKNKGNCITLKEVDFSLNIRSSNNVIRDEENTLRQIHFDTQKDPENCITVNKEGTINQINFITQKDPENCMTFEDVNFSLNMRGLNIVTVDTEGTINQINFDTHKSAYKPTGLYKISNLDNNSSSYYNAALRYEKGQGVEQDYKKAGELYQIACDSGNSFACYNLGILYDDGKGREKNHYDAKKLYQRACDGGNFLGCFNLTKNL